MIKRENKKMIKKLIRIVEKDYKIKIADLAFYYMSIELIILLIIYIRFNQILTINTSIIDNRVNYYIEKRIKNGIKQRIQLLYARQNSKKENY